jgi:hypothetical protein
MANSYTTNYSWILPEVGQDTDAWGTHLNYNFGDAVNGVDKVVKDISNIANAALPKAGGTVTGAVTFSGGSTTLTMGAPIILSGNPTSSTHAANKAYVDAGDNTNATAAAAAQTTANAALARSGGTMTGFLTLNADPTANLHATTKQYTDTKLSLSGGTMTGVISFAATQPTATTSDPNIVLLTDSISSTSTTTAATPNSVRTSYNLANSALQRSGGTMTGKITLDGDPTVDLHAVPRQYVVNNFQPLDADLTAIAGFTGTGFAKRTGANTWTLDTNTYLTGNQNISVSGDASGSGATSIALTLASTGVTAGTYTKVTTDIKGRITAGTSLAASDIPTITASKISDFDTQVRTSRLDQMAAPTASVSLNSQKITSLADPSASSDAATKNYVDTYKLDKSGGTLTGNLTIQNGTSQMALILGSSGGYFYADATNAGWYKASGASVYWNVTNGNFNTNGSITAGAAISGSSLSSSSSVSASTSISAGTDISAGGAITAASGTISGTLGVATPTSSGHATTKSYVDTAIGNQLDLVGTKTMTGNLTIQSGSTQMKVTLGNSGGYFYADASNAGWYKSGSCAVSWNTTDGSLTSTGNITAYSDERIKTDILTIEYALDKVRQLRGVTYKRKETGAAGLGVIAQEVLEVVPEVVQKNNDGMLSVAYGNLVGLLIEAVKELSSRVEELEAR